MFKLTLFLFNAEQTGQDYALPPSTAQLRNLSINFVSLKLGTLKVSKLLWPLNPRCQCCSKISTVYHKDIHPKQSRKRCPATKLQIWALEMLAAGTWAITAVRIILTCIVINQTDN